ncbi:MAG: hypothetical protein ACI39R_04000 [Lachnospiraceae bacterium]
MREKHDREFHFSPEKNTPTDEFRTPPEFPDTGKEFPYSVLPPRQDNEFNRNLSTGIVSESGRQHSRVKKYMLLPVTAGIAVVSLVFAAFQYDPLGNDIFADTDKTAVVTLSPDNPREETDKPVITHTSEMPADPTPTPWEENRFSDEPDDSFPHLTNLSPNGEIPDLGVINEEYIRIASESEELFIAAGSAWAYYDENWNAIPVPISTVPGISYDADTNTLTLDNYKGPLLDVNLMGNSFTIRLIGDNSLDKLLVWGFYYGGSVTITGDGSLTVNKDMSYETGIELTAEFSESCLMVDGNVTLDVYGTKMAVVVHATSMEKAIYYLSPLTLTGGVRTGGDYVRQNDGQYASVYEGFHDYTIAKDESGTPSKHITLK